MFERVLERIGLEEPDGRPIYGYEITEEEYRELQNCVRDRAEREPGSWSNKDAAEFCIYVSEWWRRAYDGGRWTFSAPLEQVGMEGWNSQYQRLHRLIQRGLKYLGRELIELGGNRQFLGTLAAQGGLPLNLMRGNAAGHVPRAFRAMFRELRIFGTQQVTDKELGERELHRLPQAFQNTEGMAKLLGKTAMVVWEHAQVAGNQDNPLEQLDSEFSGWRQELPLKPNDDQIRALLEEILGEAQKEKSLDEKPFQAIRRLSRNGGDWTLEAGVEGPSRIPAARVAALFEVDESSLPYTLSLMAEYEGDTRAVAIVSRDNQDSYLVEAVEDGTFIGPQHAAGTIRLRAFAGENEFGNVRPVIGKALGEEPWVFSDKQDATPLQLFSTGSVRTKRDEILVVVNPQAKIDEANAADFQEIGMLAGSGRPIYRMAESTSVVDEDGTKWKIHCQSETDDLVETSVSGQLWGFNHRRGLPVYDEEPIVQVGRERLAPTDMRWKVGHEESLLSDASFGEGVLRAYDDEGHALFQRRMCRLPESASLRVRPATNDDSGRLLLDGFGDVKVGTPEEQVEISQLQEGGSDEIKVRFDGEGQPPSEFPLFIRWEAGGETTFTVPFPKERARFVANGRVLKDRGTWVVHAMNEIVAQVSTEGGMVNEPYIQGELRAEDVNYEVQKATEFEMKLRKEFSGSDWTGRYKLPLSRIREEVSLALAGTMDLDAHVELKLTWPGATNEQTKRVKLFRYEGEVNRIDDGDFEVTSRLSEPEHWSEPELSGFQFQDPGSGEPLARLDENTWIVADEDGLSPGTWCVVGMRSSRLSHRPVVFKVEGEYEENEWSRVCEIPGRGRRRRAFRELFHKMAGDPEHHGWNALQDIFEIAKQLPATTFDALDCLVEVPEATAMALIRARADIERWWSELEELPFLWHLISVQDWAEATNQYLEVLAQHYANLDVDLDKSQVLEPVVGEIRRRSGQESPLFAFLNSELGLGLDSSSREIELAQRAEHIVEQSIADGFGDLLRRKDPDHHRWPNWEPQLSLKKIECFERFRADTSTRWRQPVADAPLVAALACATSTRLPRADVLRLRRLRSFDRRWFDFCYRANLTRALAHFDAPTLLPDH